MDLDQVKKLIDLIKSEGIEEFELEEDDLRIRIKRATTAPTCPAMPTETVSVSPRLQPATFPSQMAPEGEEPLEEGLVEVRSPIVGSFYRAPSPGADAFVEVGDVVKRGQILCIVEAMKLMNEIKSDVDGEIVSINVDNEQPVEYSELLFTLRSS